MTLEASPSRQQWAALATYGFGVAVMMIGPTVGGIVGGTVGVSVGSPAAARNIGMLDCSATRPATLVV